MSFYVAAEPRGETHPVDEVLPPTKLAVYGFQHVLAFYAGAVIVPILLASAIGLRGEDLVYLISADLLTCGIASLIQAVGFWKVGVRLPLLQGVTFTAVAPMIAIGTANGGGVDGLLAIYGAVIVAGVVTFFAAPYFSRLLRLFPPVVTGTVITVIGVTLLPVAAQQAGGGNPSAPDFGSFQNIELAAATLIFIVVLQRLFRGKLPGLGRRPARPRVRHRGRGRVRPGRHGRRLRGELGRRHHAVPLRPADVRRRRDRLDADRDVHHRGRDDR